MGYFELRDKVCNLCDSQHFRTINSKTEKICFEFGRKIAEYAPCLISFFVVLYAALALGIFSATYNSDLYYQWIEEGSRLIGERQFIEDYHGFSINRNEYLIATGQGSDSEMMTQENYGYIYELAKSAIMINVTDPKDSDFPELGWFELCARIPMPVSLLGPMRFFGGKGLPCTIYTGLDCFRQGEYNYDVPVQLRGDNAVKYKYGSEPDFTTLNQTEMWQKMSGHFNGSNSGTSCTNWVEASVPENFMWGAVHRVPVNNTLVVDGVHSIQQVMLAKTETQLAQWKCVEKCVVEQNCYNTMKACYDGCTLNAANLYGVACITNMSVDPILGPQLTAAVLTYCVYGNSSTCPPQLVANGGICGSCYNDDPLAPVTAACQNCQKALVQTSSLPLTGSALYDGILACLTPFVEPCVKLGCFAEGSLCEYNCTQSPKCAKPPQSEIDAALVVLLQWEQNYLDFMERVQDNYPFKLAYFADRSTDDLVHQAGQADAILIVTGYFAMIVFGCITLIRYDALQSRLVLGFGGMLMVILSIVGAMGFSAMVGIVFVPTIVQVLPFLALGMGTYDMFILAFAFQYLPGETVPSMIGELMKECGPRLLLTALTNIIVFGIGANIPLRAVNLFSGAMCIVVLFNFLILVVAFTALISLHAERIHRDKIDCICCFQAPSKHTAISPHQDDQIGWLPIKFAQFAFWWPTKILCIIGAAVIFGVAMWGATRIEIGLPLSDIVPKDSAAYNFLSAREQSYGSYPSYLFTRLNINMTDPLIIGELLRLESELQKVGGMDQGTPIYSTSWLDKFLWFCNQSSGCPQQGNYPNRTIERITKTGHETTTNFWPNGTHFYYWLNLYFTTTSDGPYYQQYVNLNPDGTILSSRISMVQAGLDSDQKIVNFIKDTRKITDASFIPCFPGGFLFDLYEQYVHVHEQLTSNLGYTALGVLGVSFFFLLHPAAVFINVCMIGLTLAECYGFLALFHLKLNGVSVVNLVLAIGLIVVPTEHITRVFMVTPGTTTDRARRALGKMVFPMAFATISTFLGELPMEFAKFPYFRLYFFYQYVIIGLLTLFNSFLALPYLLEYFGPPAIVGPKTIGSSRSSTAFQHDPLASIEMPTLEETRDED